MVFYFFTFNFSESKNLLEVDSHFSPDTVGVGDKANLVLSIKNLGNTTTIQSISVRSLNWPTNITSLEPDSFILNKSSLGSNKSLLVNIEVHVGQTLSGGNYIIETVISTPFSDYVVPSKLTVNRIESIPFSGNIPLSILVLVFAGVITYGIMIYVITRKFDRSYVEIGLFSVGFGILNWAIGYSMNLINIPERIYFEPLAIAILLAISAGTGGIIGLLVIGVKKLWAWRAGIKQKTSIERDIMRKGYVIGEGYAWAKFIQNDWDEAKMSYGKRYSVTLRVHLKHSLNMVPFVEGILFRLELEPPYDLILEPKYVVSCSDRSRLLEILTESTTPILLETLRIDKRYRNNIAKYLIDEQGATSITTKSDAHDVHEEIIKQFFNKMKTEDFFLILNVIDLSIYGERIVKSLLEKYHEHSFCEYGERVFIPGENISRVQIIKYDAFYGMELIEKGERRVIPPAYEIKENPYKKDVTPD
jgi:hypothetical protein